MIVYLGLNIQFHGLEIKSQRELNEFIETIKHNLLPLRSQRFGDQLNSDLIVDVEEIGGSIEE
jgi:hypothetical protein